MGAPRRSWLVAFGHFQVDLQSGELRTGDGSVVLQSQPLQLLAALLERPGQLVAREDLRRRLWPADTFVDFEHGLNAAVRRLRRALGDSADAPQFVETLHRRGYRFVDEVLSVGGADGDPNAGVSARHWRRAKLVVLPFSLIDDEKAVDAFTEGLTEETISQLTRRIAPAIGVVLGAMHGSKGVSRDGERVRRDFSVDYVLKGRVRHAFDRVRITSQLVDPADDTHVWAQVYDRGYADTLSTQQDVAESIAQDVATRLIASNSQYATTAKGDAQ